MTAKTGPDPENGIEIDLEYAMRWLDDHVEDPERLQQLLAELDLDEEAMIRSIAKAAADGDPEARTWVLSRRPHAVDRLLDAAREHLAP